MESSSNYILVEFLNKSLEIVNVNDVLSPMDYKIGDKIMISWPSSSSKKKGKEYTVNVLEISMDKEYLGKKLESLIAEDSEDDEETGRGKRKVKPARRVIDDDVDGESLQVITKKKSKSEKKNREEALVAKSIIQQLGIDENEDPVTNTVDDNLRKNNELLQIEVTNLKRKVADLEEELKIAKDLKLYLHTAKKLVKRLTTNNNQHTSSIEASEVVRVEPTSFQTELPENRQVAVCFEEETHPHLQWTKHSINLKMMLKSLVHKSRSYVGVEYANKLTLVVELLPSTKIFIDGPSRITLPFTCRTATSLARTLMDKVFTSEALLTCSVKGGVAKGIGRPDEKREGLYPPAIKAITDFVIQLKTERGWNKDAEYKDLIRAMGTKLSELRTQGRKNQI